MLKTQNIQDIYRLSPLQEGIYFHSLSEAGSSAYISQKVFKVKGELKVPMLSKGLGLLMERHEALRTVFNHKKADVLLQAVLRTREPEFHFEDWAGLASGEAEARLAEYAAGDRERNFDLGRDALLRVAAFRLAPGEYGIIWCHHHIILDGWCGNTLLQEFITIYQQLAEGLSPDLPAVPGYRKFIDWIGNQSKDAALDYWRGYLADIEPGSKLFTEGAGNGDYLNAELELNLGGDFSDRLRNAANFHKLTVNRWLQTVWGILVGKLTGSDDIAFGQVVAIRPAEVPGIERIMGLFINTLPVRIRFAQSASFLETAAGLQSDQLRQESFNYLSLSEILSLPNDGARLIDHLFIFENFPGVNPEEEPEADPAGGRALPDAEIISGFSQTNYDFNLIVLPNRDITIKFNFNARSVPAGKIEALRSHFKHILEQSVRDPLLPLQSVALITGAERKDLLERNPPRLVRPEPLHLLTIFEQNAERYPGATAVTDMGRNYTYAGLDTLSKRIAGWLQSVGGISPGDRVGVCQDRSVYSVACMLGIWKAAAAYVPIEPGLPAERIAYIAEAAGLKQILSAKALLTSGTVLPDLAVAVEDLIDQDHSPVDTQADPRSTAYIIFTSGTAGIPKGVPIRHESLADRILFHNRYIGIGKEDRVLHMAALAFDASLVETGMPLAAGGQIVIAPAAVKQNLSKLAQLMENHGVTAAIFPPAMLRLIAQESDFPALQKIISTGEAVLAEDAAKLLSARSVFNGYGPTESCIGATFHRLEAGRLEEYREKSGIPIGKPFENTAVYILNPYLELVPDGFTGEICIAGIGVADGYLQDPDLTAKKFVNNPFARNVFEQTLYRTGDLGRWNRLGELEYLGRMDDQVQIRGIRVEPAEIAWQLRRVDGVEDAFVQAVRKEDRVQIVAWWTGDKHLRATTLRKQLSVALPEYMVPAVFIRMDAFPLNAAGKVDRRKLIIPDPDSDVGIQGQGSLTPAEQLLCGLLGEILNKQHTTAGSDFFALGGDSIKAIQLVSRAYRNGFDLTVRDVFDHPVIGEMALQMKPLRASIPQDAVTGEVPLTPIQHEFFAMGLRDPNHFNHSAMFLLPDPVPEAAVRRILKELLVHHDMLRAACETDNRGGIRQIIHPEDLEPRLEVFDLRSDPEAASRRDRICDEIQQSIRLDRPPLMAAALFIGDKEDRLLLVIHHLVIDGISWRILLEDLHTLFELWQQNSPLTLPLKTDSYKAWAEGLVQHVGKAAFTSGLEQWRLERFRLNPPWPKMDGAPSANGVETFTIDPALWERLIAAGLRVYGADAAEMLLTAFALSVRDVWESSGFSVMLESHGRANILPHLNISRTVGWFTAMYPVMVNIPAGDPGKLLASIKDELRNVPDNGIGFGMARHLYAGKPDWSGFSGPEILFNYLGRFEAQETDPSGPREVDEYTGLSDSGVEKPPFALSVSAAVDKGCLQVHLRFDGAVIQPEDVESLSRAFQQRLGDLDGLLSGVDRRILTPSDLTWERMPAEELEAVVDHYKDLGLQVSDAYPLAPLQEGMLFHHLMHPQSGAYFYQVVYQIKGDLHPDYIEESLNRLISRHDILRTVFNHRLASGNIQVVLQKRTLKIHRAACKMAVSQEFIRHFLENDRANGFDLTADLLLRVALVTTDTDTGFLIWSSHHILMDGWCFGLLAAEFKAIYSGLKAGNLPVLQPVIQYRNYIRWLIAQDRTASENYWKNYLEGYETPVGLTEKTAAPDPDGDPDMASSVFHFSRESTDRIYGYCRDKRITPGTFLQTCWGILLCKYNNRADAVFGLTVSGRSPQVEGIESMTGLFINTVPVRVSFSPETRFGELVGQQQAEALTATDHHHLSLSGIQQLSVPRQKLINHVFVFENLPAVTASGAAGEDPVGWEIEDAESYEHTNYDLSVVVVPTDRIRVKLQFDRQKYSEEFIGRVAAHFMTLAEEAATGPEKPVDSLSVITEPEIDFLRQVNRTEAPFKPGTVLDFFRAHAGKHPNAPAIRFRDMRWDYGKLDRESDLFAAFLVRRCGVKAGDIVALKMERSPWVVATILGILKTGSSFLVVDRNVPLERMRFMLSDCAAPLLVVDEWVAGYENLPCPARPFREYELEDEPLKALPATVYPQDIAYTIYTSGSTGTPKGVQIRHLSLAHYADMMVSRYEIGPSDRAILLSSLAFDHAYAMFWPALVAGIELTILPENAYLDAAELIRLLIDNGITILNLTPTVLNLVVHDPRFESGGRHMRLRFLFLGGEKIRMDDVRRFVRYHPHPTRFMDEYGPTEATVGIVQRYFSLAGPEDREAWEEACQGTVIGKPIRNHKIYILDKGMNQVGIGIPGELCISGIGLAKGYLNKPDLNREKFVTNPFEPGKKMYRTGDLARWLPDGQIEFIGRIDFQVKIRGYRIELGEIDQTIRRFPETRDAAVTAIPGKPDPVIVAYVIFNDQPKTGELARFLKERLPEYMQPASIMPMEAFPLIANGKTNLKALPLPDIRQAAEEKRNRVPETEMEQAAARVFTRVLGRDIQDLDLDFFALGGDSIRAMQVASGLYRLGFKLEVRDVFEAPVLWQMVRRIRPVAAFADQGPVTGTVKLAPIQHAFFERNLAAPHHYNQAVMFATESRLDAGELAEIFRILQTHHDALRLVFRSDHRGIIQENRDVDLSVGFLVRDLSDQEDPVTRLETEADAFQKGFDLSEGPLIRFGLFRMPDGDRLLIAAHHLVVDAVSWRILIEDLSVLYEAPAGKRKTILPAKTASFQQWTSRLAAFARSASFKAETAYWRRMAARRCEPLVPGYHPEERQPGSLAVPEILLDPDRTGKLLSSAHQAFGTHINDLLLAALATAVYQTFGRNHAWVMLEGHGREELFEDIQLTRTVGWFTSFYPVLLESGAGWTMTRQIERMRDAIRQIPRNGIGFSILRYLSPPEWRDGIESCRPEIAFNYLGQFDQEVSQSAFGLASESMGSLQDPGQKPESGINMLSLVAEGRLRVSFSFDPDLFPATAVHRLREAYAEALTEIIDYCTADEQSGNGSGKYSSEDLTREDLEAINQLFNY
ncbi:MAG: amino acid adenylation domain-containing protein [Lewinellaceae bacterium]|nr:amino acid adenylation domain-containing protein [Lewinellaceae bacterium]